MVYIRDSTASSESFRPYDPKHSLPAKDLNCQCLEIHPVPKNDRHTHTHSPKNSETILVWNNPSEMPDIFVLDILPEILTKNLPTRIYKTPPFFFHENRTAAADSTPPPINDSVTSRHPSPHWRRQSWENDHVVKPRPRAKCTFHGGWFVPEIRRENQLRFVVEIPWFTRFGIHPRWWKPL